jgi:hypothetical protein
MTMSEKILVTEYINAAEDTEAQMLKSEPSWKEILAINKSREVITDYYVPENVSSESKHFAFKVFVRLNAKKITFKNVSFMHCIFDNCYLNHCVFDSCNFTGSRFVGSNFHQTAFSGCKFEYAIFERSQLDDDILCEAPKEENLRMRFARSLRMNYQQIGDAKAVNKAITLELEATSVYLYKSWRSGEKYYKEKYPGLLNSIVQFLKWLEFWVLDFIWGNGESIFKLLRSIFLNILVIAAYDTNTKGGPLNIGFYWDSLQIAPAVFLGVLSPQNFTTEALSIITGAKLVSIALLTALLVKRFSRR